jgi:putative SOS response-associated peptidase YedK
MRTLCPLERSTGAFRCRVNGYTVSIIKRMCGRFTLRNIQGRKLDWILTRAGWVPRYNIAPTQDILVVMPDGEQKEVVSLRWGLIPWWSKEPKGFINARVETIDQKQSFKDSFERRRCLILADGFYEWERMGKKISQPYYFQMKDQGAFTFAGIWDRWQQPDGQTITSCAIITTVANELLARFHTRMPVILESELHDLWLKENSRVPDLKELLIPFPADQMMSHAVTYDVNNVRIDEERLVQPVEPNIGVTLPLF